METWKKEFVNEEFDDSDNLTVFTLCISLAFLAIAISYFFVTWSF